jgi:hypothetical protein
MTRHFHRSLTLLVALASASSLFGVHCDAKEKTLKAGNYTIQAPPDWEVLEEKSSMLTIREPMQNDTDTFGENIRIVKFVVGKVFSVTDVLRRQKSDTERFKLIGEGKVSDAKVPMVWMALTPKVPRDEDDKLVKIDFITTRGTDIVVITAMSELHVWDKYLPRFAKIAATFQPISLE